MPILLGNEINVEFLNISKLKKDKRYYIDTGRTSNLNTSGENVILSGIFEGEGSGWKPSFRDIKIEQPESLKTMEIPRSLDTSEFPFKKGIKFYEIRDTISNNSNIQACSICKDPLSSVNSEGPKGTITVLACKHRFHRDCINSWINSKNNTKCPMCRGSFNKIRYGGTRKSKKSKQKTRKH
jgi:hypothetical protein